MKRLAMALLLLLPAAAISNDRWPDAGGGGGSFPGLSGTTGSEDTLDALYALRNLDLYPDGPTYYFSCDAAGDYPLGASANAGTTPTTALLNWADVAAIRRTNITLRFDAVDTCFVFAAGADFDVDITTPYGRTDVLARIDSSEVGRKALITQTGAPTIGFTHVTDTGADLPSNAGGILVAQDLNLVGFTRHVFIVDDGVGFEGLNISVAMADSAASENLMRPRANSDAVCLNCSGSSYDDYLFAADESSNQTIIGQGVFTMSTPGATTNGIINNTATTTTRQKEMTIIGHTLLMPATNAGNKRIVLQNQANISSAILRMARVLVYGGGFGASACVQLGEYRTGVSGAMQFEGYQISLVECDIGFQVGIFTSDVAGSVATGTSRTLKYSLIQGNAGVTKAVEIAEVINTVSGTWDTVSNLVNEQGGGIASLFRYRNESSAYTSAPTVAGFHTDIDADSAAVNTGLDNTFTVASTPVTSTDQTSSTGIRCADTLGTGGVACIAGVSDAIGGTADGLCDESSTPESCGRLVETAVCGSGLACFNALNAPYTIEFGAPVYISPTIKIERLNLTARNYGAR